MDCRRTYKIDIQKREEKYGKQREREMEISKDYGQVASYIDRTDISDNSNMSIIAEVEIDDYDWLLSDEYADQMIAQYQNQTSYECIQVLKYLNRNDAYFDYDKSTEQSKIGE